MGDMSIPLHFASLYIGQEVFVWSDCGLDLDTVPLSIYLSTNTLTDDFEFQTQIAACIVIQRAWRQYLVTMTTQRREAAAVCLQALWRGRQGRVQADLLRRAKADEMLHEAAAKIQVGLATGRIHVGDW